MDRIFYLFYEEDADGCRIEWPDMHGLQFTLTSFYMDFELFSKFSWFAANMWRYRSRPEDAGQVPA